MTGTSKNKRRISLPCLSAVYAAATPSPPYPKYRPAQQPLFSCASEAVHIRSASCQAAAVPFGLLRFLREQYPSWQECKIVPVALQYSFFLLLFWSFFRQYSFLVRRAPFASSAHRHRVTIAKPAPSIVRTLVWVSFS